MTRKKLYEMHWEQRRSFSEIAKLCGRSVAWVQKQFKKYGVVPRSVAEACALRRKDITGRIFGQLRVLTVTEGPPKRAIATCQCSCGKICAVPVPRLRSGGKKSCGCAWKKNYEEMSGEFLGQLKRQAKSRGFAFDITPKMMWDLYINQDKKCALSGLPLCFGSVRTASLDRICSSKGYTLENVQWVHKDINQMKMDLDQDYFLSLVHAIDGHIHGSLQQQNARPPTNLVGVSIAPLSPVYPANTPMCKI